MSGPPRVPALSRREALCGLVGSCALAALGCGGAGEEMSPLTAAGPGCGVPPGEGWVEVPLAEHPQLREVGGAAAVEVPEAFLQVVVAQRAPGCFVAVWRLCTHGACAVDYHPDAHHFECPCHGSQFDEEGRVLRGPAVRPLQTFPVARVGDSLFIGRSGG